MVEFFFSVSLSCWSFPYWCFLCYSFPVSRIVDVSTRTPLFLISRCDSLAFSAIVGSVVQFEQWINVVIIRTWRIQSHKVHGRCISIQGKDHDSWDLMEPRGVRFFTLIHTGRKLWIGGLLSDCQLGQVFSLSAVGLRISNLLFESNYLPKLASLLVRKLRLYVPSLIMSYLPLLMLAIWLSVRRYPLSTCLIQIPDLTYLCPSIQLSHRLIVASATRGHSAEETPNNQSSSSLVQETWHHWY